MALRRPLGKALVNPLGEPLGGPDLPWEVGVGGGARTLDAFTGFTDTGADFLRTQVNDEGLVGSTSFSVAVLFRLTSAADTAWLGATNNASGNGWSLYHNGTDWRFRMDDGVGTDITSPTTNAPAVGTTNLFVGVHDGTKLRLYLNGSEVGSGTSITGYTANSGVKQQIGIRLTTNAGAFDTGDICGMCGSDSDAWSAAEISTLWDDTKAGYALATVAGKTERLWTAAGRTSVPDPVPDDVGSEDMEHIAGGSGLSIVSFVPAWGS